MQTPGFINRKAALDVKIRNFGEDLWCYSPSLLTYSIDQHKPKDGFRFLPISITGQKCQLQCDHCRGQILKSMFPAETPDSLEALINNFAQKNTEGILISGGSLLNGSVPLISFIPTLKKIKEQYDLSLVIHTGLVTQDLAMGLAEVGVDAVMLDIIGDNETITNVCHLLKTINDFELSLKMLERYNIPTVPHVIVGLNYGKLAGELKAVDIIAKHPLKALVVVALMPLENTPMEAVAPPRPDNISSVITYSRMTFPKTPIILGCARPRGIHKISTDISAIKSGVNGIAFISQEGANYAKKRGYRLRFSDHCCSLIFKDIKLLETAESVW